VLAQIWSIASKDLRSEFRTKEAINASVAFAMVILLMFSFAFEPTSNDIREIAGGLLWLVFVFAGIFVLNRSFARELPNDCLDVLLTAPVSSAALFLGKTLANYLLLLLVEVVAIPVFGVFYNARWYWQAPTLLMVLLLGTWGIAVVGTAFSALTVNLKLREVMLPVLIYPLVAPVVLAAIQATSPLAIGQPLVGDVWAFVRLMIGFDVIFTAASIILIDIVLVG
jgi:heme exporter protein B